MPLDAETLLKRITDLELLVIHLGSSCDGKDGRHGKNGLPGIGIQGPPGKNGTNGQDAVAIDQQALIETILARIPVPKDGADGKGERGPPGEPGRPGRDGIDAPARAPIPYAFQVIRDDFGQISEVIATPIEG